ncbi:MAG: hypothetical protein EBT71_05385, partial [Alphaproteobacteria bacterium]|nr:hypothetical protein [Alphaproteobacteria bacterium]
MTDCIAHFLPRRLLPTALLFALICLLLMCLPLTGNMAAHAAGQVNVYSYRQPMLVKPLFDR